MDIVQEFFVNPIFEKTGYNMINTLTYAAIAIISLYFIWTFLKKKGFDFSSREFLYAVAAFVLFGSTARVVTDITDSGMIAAAAGNGGMLGPVYSAVTASGIFAYGYLTVTPGIYIVTAMLLLSSIAIERVTKQKYFAAYAGALLWLPCFLLLIPFMRNFDFLALGFALASVFAFAAILILKIFAKIEVKLHEALAISGQALDGAATFTVIDIFSKFTGKGYFEQHVVSAGIGTATPLGFGLFLIVKVTLAALIVYFVRKESMDEKDRALLLIVVAIMGFAPGIRDLLRMLVGS